MIYKNIFEKIKMIRVGHSRFLEKRPVGKKGNRFDKVVTSVWSFEPENSILTYGATIYRKSSPKDLWNKQEHHLKAKERYENNPVRIRLVCHDSEKVPELCNIAIDWYIAENLIYKFGTHNKNAVDVRRLHGTSVVHYDFNEEYSRLNHIYKSEELMVQSNVSLGPFFNMLFVGAAFYISYVYCTAH